MQFTPNEATRGAEIAGLLDLLGTSLNYALMGVITLTMYHLKLTLRYLLIDQETIMLSTFTEDKIAKGILRKERYSTALMVLASLVFFALMIVSFCHDRNDGSETVSDCLL